ncbi:transmembrane protein 147 [Strongylocentrotus purpuratus]|uniref:BOS complex subunit TMEM147 n=1 Tax=Strongylocentrotus purpuratus TaxID=7668 RepID=A0A7M7NDE5_STRPU|nr:transmembrane protein 147 [Strongylocentrotus purpuratus]
MTLFHFGNCVALAYIPYFIVYKCSGLSEYSAFWKCVQAGTAYLFTQLCKMMILATFFPTSEGGVNHLDIMGEFMKSTIDLGDLIGFYFIMNSISAKGELKFLVAGVGWATAELIMTRVVPMWVGARGTEFDWKYIQLSLESNVNLVQHISTAALVWLWSRHDLNKSVQPIVVTLLALSSYKPLVVEILIHAAGLGSWTLLLAKSFFTFGVGFVALQLYVGLQGTLNHYTK